MSSSKVTAVLKSFNIKHEAGLKGEKNYLLHTNKLDGIVIYKLVQAGVHTLIAVQYGKDSKIVIEY